MRPKIVQALFTVFMLLPTNAFQQSSTLPDENHETTLTDQRDAERDNFHSPEVQSFDADQKLSQDSEENADYQMMNTVSPADELRRAAAKAGYNISDVTLQLAVSSTDEQLTEQLPEPLAQALIDRRRLPDLRDRLIGMTFFGQPVPLDYKPRRKPFEVSDRSFSDNVRRWGASSRRFQPSDLYSAIGRQHILRPVSISSSRSGLILPEIPNFSNVGQRQRPPQMRSHPQESRQSTRIHTETRPRLRETGKNVPSGKKLHKSSFLNEDRRLIKNSQNGPLKTKKFNFRNNDPPKQRLPPPPKQNFPPLRNNFGNSDGPDFGPVVFEFSPPFDQSNKNDFGGPNGYMTFDSAKISPPDGPFPPHVIGSSEDSFNPRLKHFKPSKHFPPTNHFENFGGIPESQTSIATLTLPRDPESRCNRYTETICLDTNNYPHAEILRALEGEKSRTDVLIAEVRNQSADDLVDGVSAREEARYDYSHYFGKDDHSDNRRKDTASHHRDFADDGGYLCPSEVKYARPKRAKNSKGKWKFIVNMNKYSQTIRMEKCIQPGGACSYVSHHYKATCNQVHNYQRLLSWEKERGLHMDIFKVPSCCTCHIQGYSFAFPPLNKKNGANFSSKKKRPPHFKTRPNRGSHLNNRTPNTPFEFPNKLKRFPSRGTHDNSIRRKDSNIEEEVGQETTFPMNREEIPSTFVDQHDNQGPVRRNRHELFNRRQFNTPIEQSDRWPIRMESGRSRSDTSKIDGSPSSGSVRSSSAPIRPTRNRNIMEKRESPNSAIMVEESSYDSTDQENARTIIHGHINYNYHPISQFFDN